jgi:hypothetical protein
LHGTSALGGREFYGFLRRIKQNEASCRCRIEALCSTRATTGRKVLVFRGGQRFIQTPHGLLFGLDDHGSLGRRGSDCVERELHFANRQAILGLRWTHLIMLEQVLLARRIVQTVAFARCSRGNFASPIKTVAARGMQLLGSSRRDAQPHTHVLCAIQRPAGTLSTAKTAGKKISRCVD